MAMRRLGACVGVCALLGLTALAVGQPPGGTPAVAAYRVTFRYAITTDLQQRYTYYQQMLARLKAVGFKPEAGLPQAELYGDRLTGVLPAGGLSTLRSEPFLRTAMLVPEGVQLPADAERTVLVRLELTTVLGPGRQSEVANQARGQLRPLGFVENEGYEHVGHTRLLGRLPVPALSSLLNSSMEVALSKGTFQGPTVTVRSPLVRLATVIAEPSPAQTDARRPVPAQREYLDKLSPDLRAFLAKVPEGDVDKLIRVELVLRGYSFNTEARRRLVDTEVMFIPEGSYGPVVSGLVTPSRVPALAQVPVVSTVRLPQSAEPFLPPGNPERGVEFVPLGLEKLPSLTQVDLRPRGPSRTIILGDDFRGYEKLVGTTLPKATRLVDVTPETRPDLSPAPYAEGAAGQSLAVAEAFLKTHPAEEVQLVRIDPSRLYQMAEVGETLLGHGWQTDAFRARQEEIQLEAGRIATERTEVRLMRARVLNEFGIDENARAKREEYRVRAAALEAREKNYHALEGRMQKYQDELARLRGAGTVLVALQWDDGYVDLPGQSPRLRYLSTEVLGAAHWYQAVAVRPGQTWSGLFRDQDADGVMEFTHNLRLQRPDLAFLNWRPFGATSGEANLPEGTVVEVTINWSEAHDPILSQDAKDVYRRPLADLTVNILRQRDPKGEKLPTDVFEVLGRTPFLPDRVENDPRYSVYQNTVRFVVPPGGGRIAVQVSGHAPTSTLPAGIEPTMPERQELRPKIVLEVVDPQKRSQGRVVFEQFATAE